MKLLLNISIPAVGQNYDILIPDSLRIKTIIAMISDAVIELSGGLYSVSGSECLCSVEKNILLRHNGTLSQYGIQNGDHLIMI